MDARGSCGMVRSRELTFWNCPWERTSSSKIATPIEIHCVDVNDMYYDSNKNLNCFVLFLEMSHGIMRNRV